MCTSCTRIHSFKIHCSLNTKKFIETFEVSSDPKNDPTLSPIKCAAPLMGYHFGDPKAYTYQGFNHIYQRMDNLHSQTQEMQKELKNALQQNYKLISQVANVVNAAVTAAYKANHDLAFQMPTIAANPSPPEQQEEATNNGMAEVPLLTNNTTNSENGCHHVRFQQIGLQIVEAN